MDTRRIEYAPYALYALAAGALALSLLVRQFSDPPESPRLKLSGPVAAERSRPSAARPAVVRQANWSPRYRPGLSALAPRPVDYVRTVHPPLVAPVIDGPLPELIVLAPARPQWKAGDTPAFRLLVGDTLGAAFRIGRALGVLQNRVARLADWQVVSRPAAQQAGTKVIRSPESLSAQLVIGPGDRLAMATDARAAGKPLLAIRQRVSSPDLAPQTVELNEAAVDPVALRKQLEELLDAPASRDWALDALGALELLVNDADLSVEAYGALTRRLADLAQSGRRIAEQCTASETAVRLRKASWAIDRRAETWRVARRIEERAPLAGSASPGLGNAALRDSLEQLASTTANTPHGDGWRRYLRTLQLQSSLAAASPPSLANRQALARDILAQIAAQRLSTPQRRFVSTGPVAALGTELAVWAAEPVDVSQLLQEIEQYELQPEPEIAHRIALRRQQLARSGAEDHRRLAGRIDHDYRNANLRVAISREMLQRQLPPSEPRSEPVNDRIAGTPVRGAALTHTKLDIRLMPDPLAWRLAIEARGRVESSTVAHGGPARLHTMGTADFIAFKPIVISSAGMFSPAAQCTAESQSQLVGVRTQYDGVPLVSGLIRSRARDAYRDNRSRAQWETESRIRTRVIQTLDEQSAPLMERLKELYTVRLTQQADALGLQIDPIEVRTTESRLIARLRLAGNGQLAAHTPRNRAPADSVASLQLHESLLNNSLDGLDLARGPMTPEQLREALREKLPTLTPAPGKHEDRSVRLSFSPEQPARVVLADGRVELILAFQELVIDRTKFRNFKVHAYFTPNATLDGVWFTQEDPVQIEGRMRTARRANLHGVFAEVMPPGRRFALLNAPPQTRERLAGLMVTQVVIDDGWLGLALGPEASGRTAMRERFVR